MQVWLDLVDDSTVVPGHDGDVVLKVSRISLGLSSQSGNSPRQQQTSSQSPTKRQTQLISEASQQATHSATSQQGGGEEAQREAQQQRLPSKGVERRGSEKLISFDTYDDSTSSPPPQGKTCRTRMGHIHHHQPHVLIMDTAPVHHMHCCVLSCPVLCDMMCCAV